MTGGTTRPTRPHGRRAVLAALDTVRDPELDEPVTALGFVASCTVSADGDAEVQLRLPTYFCAPNFAFLMVADAYDAVSGGAGRAPGRGGARRPLRLRRDQRRGRRPGRVRRSPSAAWPTASWTSCAPTSCARRCWPAPTGSAGRCWPAGTDPDELAALTLGDAAAVAATWTGCARAAPSSACRPATTRRCWSTRSPASAVGGRRAAAAPAAGPADPGQHRGERRHLPRHAARTATPRRRGESSRAARRSAMKAVRLHGYHQQPVIDEVPEPTRQGPARRHREDRRRRRVPDRPAHHRGPVGRGDEPVAALHDRPRERRLGARGRLRGDQRRRRRHGDPAPDADLRAVPRLPGRPGHALRATAPSPGWTQRRRHGGVPAHLGAGLRQARPEHPAEGRRRAGRRRHHRLPRGAQGAPAALPGHHLRGDRRRRPRPHRHPVPGRAHRDEHHRGRPQPGRAQARRAARRARTPWSPTASRSTRSRTSPTARAPTSCSTSSPRRAPRTRASR